MFFKERMTNIARDDKVLEIGPGSLPCERADAFLDLKWENEEVAKTQRGNAEKVTLTKPIYYYDGLTFPFKDKEFDYIVCSHVIEHVPIECLPTFISEMQRVSNKGYIEFPLVFYEFINYAPVHKYFINYRDGAIIFLDKENFQSNYIHEIYRKMFYSNLQDEYMRNTFIRYKEFYFQGFQWENAISYRIVENFDELINEEDAAYYEKYFTEHKEKKDRINRICLLSKMKRLLELK